MLHKPNPNTNNNLTNDPKYPNSKLDNETSYIVSKLELAYHENFVRNG